MNQADFNPLSTTKDSLSTASAGGERPENQTAQYADIWESIQESIKNKLGVDRFGIWFQKTKLMSLEDSKMVIGVPSVIIKQFLERKYKGYLSQIAKEFTGDDLEIYFDIDPKLLQKKRKEVVADTEVIDVQDEIRSEQPAPQPQKTNKSARALEEQFWGSRHSFDRLVTTDANKLPFLAAQEIACKKTPRFDFLMVIGDAGYGKTALLEAIASGAKSSGIASKCIYEMTESWCNDYYHALQKRNTRKFRQYYRSAELLLMDGIQFLQGKPAAQDELLFTAKTLQNNGGRLVLSCNCHPNELSEIKHEFHNLVKGAFWTELVMPPESERFNIIKALADRHMVQVSPEVCTYLANTFCASLQEMNAAVATVATYASLHNEKKVDLKTASEALAASARIAPKITTLDDLCKAVAEASGISIDKIKGSVRSKKIAQARHMTIMLAREHTDMSLSDIGREIGGRAHSTVKHSVAKAKKLEEENKTFADVLDKVNKTLGY